MTEPVVRCASDYRVRFSVAVDHHGERYAARGTVRSETAADVASAATDLLLLMLARALEQFATATPEPPPG